MKLIGSIASPFVRRIRILLDQKDFEFVPVNVFSEEGKKLLDQYTPTRRVPILIDGERIIWDSLLICEYLLNGKLNIETKKILTVINELTDSGVQLFQLRKFNIDPEDNTEFSKNNLERIDRSFRFLEKIDLEKEELASCWLYCTLDWFDFRQVYNWRDNYSHFEMILNKWFDKEIMKKTSPRG